MNGMQHNQSILNFWRWHWVFKWPWIWIIFYINFYSCPFSQPDLRFSHILLDNLQTTFEIGIKGLDLILDLMILDLIIYSTSNIFDGNHFQRNWEVSSGIKAVEVNVWASHPSPPFLQHLLAVSSIVKYKYDFSLKESDEQQVRTLSTGWEKNNAKNNADQIVSCSFVTSVTYFLVSGP